MYLYCNHMFKYVVRILISVIVEGSSDNLTIEIIELKVKRITPCVPQHSILGPVFASSIRFKFIRHNKNIFTPHP